jgi:hypothetical protein
MAAPKRARVTPPAIDTVWKPAPIERLDELDEGVLELVPLVEGVPVGEPVPELEPTQRLSLYVARTIASTPQRRTCSC